MMLGASATTVPEFGRSGHCAYAMTDNDNPRARTKPYLDLQLMSSTPAQIWSRLGQPRQSEKTTDSCNSARDLIRLLRSRHYDGQQSGALGVEEWGRRILLQGALASAGRRVSDQRNARRAAELCDVDAASIA